VQIFKLWYAKNGLHNKFTEKVVLSEVYMDPITHGIIGGALSAFSGTQVDISNPLTIGCVLGAMSPDLDVVTRIFGDDLKYIRHHRGTSHSVPVLGALSLAISIGLMFVFPEANFWLTFLWTFIGAISHTVFDILNSYGAKLLTKKRKASILMLYDPVITLLSLYLIFARDKTILSNMIVVVIFAFYIGLRFTMKYIAYKAIKKKFRYNKEYTVTVLPALMAFNKWDFVVSAEKYNYVGQYNNLTHKVFVRERFERIESDLKQQFLNSTVGKYFTEFTPNYHVKKEVKGDKTILTAIDLRYYFRNNFMHHSTITLDANNKIMAV